MSNFKLDSQQISYNIRNNKDSDQKPLLSFDTTLVIQNLFKIAITYMKIQNAGILWLMRILIPGIQWVYPQTAQDHPR